ncbi:MAG TPA: cell division protein ZapA, partial [bacterium]|nr:cell division protein ZapA [bacterium]
DPAHLRAVAAYVNEQMTALAQKSRITATPKLAVLTALNLAEEVFRLRATVAQHDEAKQRLAALEEQVAGLLAEPGAPAAADPGEQGGS